MKTTLIKMLCAWGAFLIVGSLAFYSVFAAPDASKYANNTQVQEYQSKISALQDEQDALKDRLSDVRNERYTAQQQANDISALIANTNEMIATTEMLIDDIRTRIVDKTIQISQVEEEISKKEDEIEETKNQFLEIVRAQYIYGSPTIIEVIYDSDGITDMLSKVQYMGSVMDYATKLLDKYEVQKDELEVMHNDLTTAKEELEAEEQLLVEYEEELIAQKSELEYQKGLQDDIVEALLMTEEEILADYEKAIAAEKEENARLERLLEKLAAESTGSYVGGALDWPVSKSIKYISSYYGNRTYYYMGRKVSDFHMGIDIPAAVGTDIYAAQSGKVILASSHYSYGNYMIIDHGGGITTLYAHCTKLLKGVGTYVEKGEHIAEMGSTGNSTGSHLHFEVRVNGKHTNPLGSSGSPTGSAWIVQPK